MQGKDLGRLASCAGERLVNKIEFGVLKRESGGMTESGVKESLVETTESGVKESLDYRRDFGVQEGVWGIVWCIGESLEYRSGSGV